MAPVQPQLVPIAALDPFGTTEKYRSCRIVVADGDARRKLAWVMFAKDGSVSAGLSDPGLLITEIGTARADQAGVLTKNHKQTRRCQLPPPERHPTLLCIQPACATSGRTARRRWLAPSTTTGFRQPSPSSGSSSLALPWECWQRYRRVLATRSSRLLGQTDLWRRGSISCPGAMELRVRFSTGHGTPLSGSLRTLHFECLCSPTPQFGRSFFSEPDVEWCSMVSVVLAG